METQEVLRRVKASLEEVIQNSTNEGNILLQELQALHPVDIAELAYSVSLHDFFSLLMLFSDELRHEVFNELDGSMQPSVFALFSEKEQVKFLEHMSIDELTDFFDALSDQELQEYLNMLNKNVRGDVIRLLNFESHSAGGIMDTQVLSLRQDFTVDQSIKLLQRLQPSREIHQQIYVTSSRHQLVGRINLEDLVLHKPQERIEEFMQENEFVANADEDQEAIAKKMIHYGLMTIPVVDERFYFLGVISSDTLVDVLVEEAREDANRMVALGSHSGSYFHSSFFKRFYERSCVLVILLLAGSFSGFILKSYETTLEAFFFFFIPMLVSVGGNTSSQTSTMVIQGMASGEIHNSNIFRFLRREAAMAAMLAVVLGITSFVRVYYFTGGSIYEGFAISCALAVIVIVSVILGSGMPLVLKRVGVDPAFSAGPFLATIMDILGVLIYCFMIKLLLF